MLVYYHDWYVSNTQAQHNFDIVNIDLEFSASSAKANTASTSRSKKNSDSDGGGGEEEVLDCVGYTSVAKQRNIDPRWLRANPACTHRLNAFIYRELDAISLLVSALSSPSSFSATVATNSGSSSSSSSSSSSRQTKARNASWLIETATRVRLDSAEFAAELRKLVRPTRYARHMQHELTAYARSPCADMIDYDSKCVYYSHADIDTPTLENNTSSAQQQFALRSLPVNLSKYKTSARMADTYVFNVESLAAFVEQFKQQNTTNNKHAATTTTNRPVPLSGSSSSSSSSVTSDNVESNSGSDEHSSFCEELTPPRKPEPTVISLDSSSSSSSCDSSIDSSDSSVSICSPSPSSSLSLADREDDTDSQRAGKRKRHTDDQLLHQPCTSSEATHADLNRISDTETREHEREHHRREKRDHKRKHKHRSVSSSRSASASIADEKHRHKKATKKKSTSSKSTTTTTTKKKSKKKKKHKEKKDKKEKKKSKKKRHKSAERSSDHSSLVLS